MYFRILFYRKKRKKKLFLMVSSNSQRYSLYEHATFKHGSCLTMSFKG